MQFGARPLKRAIQTYIEDGVCELLLDGQLQTGDTIRADKDDRDKLTFVTTHATLQEENHAVMAE